MSTDNEKCTLFHTRFKYEHIRSLFMNEVYLNTSKAILSANQYRCRIEWRLKTLLGEDKIVGPLDPYVNKAVDLGKIDPEEGESLIRIGRFCDSVQLSANYCRAQSFDKMRSWSDIIGRIE